jgi:transcriptional regulator with XRE-family HTH domain
MPSETTPSTQLGAVIRALMHQRGLTGKQLAKQAGISVTTVSLVLTNKFAPRRETFSKMVGVLAPNQEVMTSLMRSYIGAVTSSGSGSEARDGGEEFHLGSEVLPPSRVEGDFETEIWRVLTEGGWVVRDPGRAVPHGFFFLETDPKIYVVLKATVGAARSWFDAIGRALYRKHLVPGSRAIVAAPYRGRDFKGLSDFFKEFDVAVATPDTLVDTITQLTKPSGKALAPDVDAGSKGDGLQR